MKTITYNPETHVLVPIEPSEEMYAAANKIDDDMYCGGSQHGADIDQVWNAFVAAAPQPEPVDVEPTAYLSIDCIGERYLCFSKPADNDSCYPLYTSDQVAAAILKAIKPLEDQLAAAQVET